MSTTPQLTTEQLAAKKAAITKQQAADLDAVVESETALHLLADMLHNKAFRAGKTPSFADSLRAAATDLLAKAATSEGFPTVALDNLRRYAPDAPVAGVGSNGADPIASAEHAAAAADAA